MPSQGYMRFPTIYQEKIVFVADDDLWCVSSEGGRAERLTAGAGRASDPRFSPDGQQIAFVGRDEGSNEVYVMPAEGGPAQRLTFEARLCHVVGWSLDGKNILFASSMGQFTGNRTTICAINARGGLPQRLPFGLAATISYGPHGGVVLGRNNDEPAYWKRYRGGRVGHLWCDVEGNGTFQRLLHLNGNVVNPCWVGERIYFLSDHEGIGNLYSCTPQGTDVRRHSDQNDFYARHLSTDGTRLVFQAGADLFLFDPEREHIQRLDIFLPSQRTQRNRKFVPADFYLDTLTLHPQGHAVALTTRGKAFTMGNWEGAVIQYGEPDGVRYRWLQWLNDCRRLVAICDAPGREALIIFDPDVEEKPKLFEEIDIGRVSEMLVSPTDDVVAITNHRHELLLVDLESGQHAVVDHSAYRRIHDIAWSPDGQWLAYSYGLSGQQTAIKLCSMENGETHVITQPVLEDSAPSFDPDGKYLYFLGKRIFNPVRDSMQFEYSFPRGILPYAIPLQRNLRSPFITESRLQAEMEEVLQKKREKDGEGENAEDKMEPLEARDALKKPEGGENEATSKRPRLAIDLEGITERVIPFPVREGNYYAVQGIKGKVLLLSASNEGRLRLPHDPSGPKGVIESYDFETQRLERLIEGVSDYYFRISRDGRTLAYASRYRIRVVKAGEKPPRSENGEHTGRDTGWLDLSRVRVSVQPLAEWKQMFAEAWRLQREHFWAEDMSGVNWDAMYAQYVPLLERIGSRSELSDLIKELQGELGTSHTQEHGGDERHVYSTYRQGCLGVDWAYDAQAQRYRIAHIVRGDPSDLEATSPLTQPGLNVMEGDAVLAINGQRVGPQHSPQSLLVNQADREVQLTLESAASGQLRLVTVTALSGDQEARYREWVERNRLFVHERSQGRVAYIHVSDMNASGFAEFHRSYLAVFDAPALLIDVRWNTGGHVADLLLEKLARRRIGYAFSRWGQPEPYPEESPRGPMVTLANEYTSSNGDIFAHCFKLMGLGPVIGMRTWGGVIGVAPTHRLADDTETTQPEYAHWFKDVGWNVENYGTDPDIEVDVAPQDYVAGVDPQLARAVDEALRIAEDYPVLEPKPEERPLRSRPRI
jgi:tricorn protease